MERTGSDIVRVALTFMLTTLVPSLAEDEVTVEHQGLVHYQKIQCRELIQESTNHSRVIYDEIHEKSIEGYQAALILLGVAFILFLMSLLFFITRRRLNFDCHLLDTYFDGGGNNNPFLMTSLVLSKWTWTATFSHSAYGIVQYGLAGGLWMAVAQMVPILLFSVVAVEARIKAPGAKTFLQIIRMRYGKYVHWLMMSVAILINLLIVAMVMMEGTRMLGESTKGIGEEVLLLLLVFAMGAAVVLSGMGGILYSGYLVAAFILIMTLIYMSDTFFDHLGRGSNNLGSTSYIYDYVYCIKSDDENKDNSALTFTSTKAMMNGLLVLLSSFTHVFVDQSFWLTAVTCKPRQTVIGIITAALMWFTVPFCLSLVFGLSYLVYTVQFGTILTDQQTLYGFIPVYSSRLLFGGSGDYIMFILIAVCTVMASATQVLSLISIAMYDVYQVYINPFSEPDPANGTTDGTMTTRIKRAMRNDHYLDYDVKCQKIRYIAVGIAVVIVYPVAIIALVSDVDLPWLFSVTSIFAGGCVFPITFSVTWHRTTRLAVVIGPVGGCIAGVITWICVAANQDGGLGDFMKNTGDTEVLLAGCSVSLAFGGLMAIVISLASGGCHGGPNREEEWEATRSIDNPIMPWIVRYATDLYKASEGRQKKPHHYTVRNAFKCAEISAYVFGVVISVLAALVWPACMIVLGEFSKSVFNAWIWVGLIWALIFTIIAVIVPLVWEMVSLIKKWRSSMAWDNVPLNKIEDDLANSVYSYTTNNSNDTVLKHDDTDLTDLQVNMFNRTPLPSIGKSIGSSIATEATIHNESDSRDYTGESTSTADDKASNSFDNDGYEVEEFDDGTLKIKF